MEEKSSKAVYCAPLPYPPVRVENPNPAYARAMLDNLGGQHSEIGAVSQYFYDHLITLHPYPEIAKAFHEISIVEMHHLEIFGRLALLLGEDPRLWSQQGVQKSYWTAKYGCFAKHAPEMLYQAIQMEKGTIQKYECQMHQIQDAYVTAQLERIILDEHLHVKLLSELYQEYPPS